MARFRVAAVLLVAVAVAAPATAAASGISERSFTTSDGVRLSYHAAGSGRALLFIPGWSMPGLIWESQLRYFAARGYRAVALDPRGQGNSEIASSGYTAERRARDIHELIGALGAERVVLIGWSLGVLDALAYTRRHGSERLGGLVLVDNSIGEDPPPRSDPTFLRRLANEREKTLAQFVRGMYRNPRDDEAVRRIVEQALRLPLIDSVALLSYAEPRTYWREAVYATTVPVLYAVTARFRGQAENLKKRRPRARIEIFEDAGHALFADEPERFNRLIEDFLAEAAHR